MYINDVWQNPEDLYYPHQVPVPGIISWLWNTFLYDFLWPQDLFLRNLKPSLYIVHPRSHRCWVERPDWNSGYVWFYGILTTVTQTNPGVIRTKEVEQAGIVGNEWPLLEGCSPGDKGPGWGKALTWTIGSRSKYADDTVPNSRQKMHECNAISGSLNQAKQLCT